MNLLAKILLLALPLLFGSLTAHADRLSLPAAPVQGTPPAHLPQRGMSMATVIKEYGAPKLRHPPVGGDAPKRPPITRWDYPGFSAFFERNIVIDAVVPEHPPKLYHRKQLQTH